MGKKLVGVESLEGYICQSSNKLYMDGSILLTPGAKDELKNRGISIEYGPKPEQVPEPAPEEAPCCDTTVCEEKDQTDCTKSADNDDLILAVAGMIQTEYGITDHKQLFDISCQVVEILKENI